MGFSSLARFHQSALFSLKSLSIQDVVLVDCEEPNRTHSNPRRIANHMANNNGDHWSPGNVYFSQLILKIQIPCYIYFIVKSTRHLKSTRLSLRNEKRLQITDASNSRVKPRHKIPQQHLYSYLQSSLILSL